MKLSNVIYYRTNHFTTAEKGAPRLIYKHDLIKNKWFCKWSHGFPRGWQWIEYPMHEYFEISEQEAFIETL